MSIRLKVVLAITAVFVLGAAAVAVFMNQAYERNVNQAAIQSIARDRAVFEQLQADDTAKLAATSMGLEENDAYRDAFLAGDRDALLKVTAPLFDRLKSAYDITHWYFESVPEQGDIFLRVHKPAQFGDVLKRKTYLAASQGETQSAGLELGATAVALRVVRPYYDVDGKLIGYMELGQEIDKFLEEIEDQTGDDVGLLLVKEGMDSSGWAAMRTSAGLEDNWDAQNTYVLAATTDDEAAAEMAFDKPIEAVAEEGEVIGRFETAEGGTEVRGVFPIADAAGTRIGLIYVRHDITEAAAGLREDMLLVLGAVIAMLALVLLVVVLLMNGLVFGRLDRMIEGMEDISLRLAGGDLDVVYKNDGSKDEIGRFQTFFAQFIAMTASTLKQLVGEAKRG